MNDIITDIRELRYGVRVTVNDRETVCLRNKNCKNLTLREGDRVDLKEWKHDLLLQQYPDALNRAVRLLAVRARSVAEIEKRLTDACYLPDTAEMVITKLVTNGLLSDEEFARQWARERTARQMGKARILYELRQKGVDDALAERVISELDPEKQESGAAKLAEKLIRRYRNASPADARRKAIQAMQRRGYSYAEARRALSDMTDDADVYD
ncbi:MAG TPA: regulatory protein RecX [Candidatus Limiplasma sp.]|nr:regulatory protein RecX [Candidatus Limiplasma sp.]HRX09708.1 regulatory protein RecX [Candidatus Limiplasma sp.]